MSSTEYLRDDRAESFFQIGDLTKLIAEKHCKVPIDDPTLYRWQELLCLLREFDTLVDDTQISKKEALQRLDTFEAFQTHYPNLSHNRLPQRNRVRLLNRTEQILTTGDALSKTDSIDEFIDLRTLEGKETANLLDDSATDEVRSNPRFAATFLPVMRSLAVTACLLDSITDARQDHEEAKISITPDRNFYSRLSVEALKSSKKGLPALGHIAVMHHFGIMSVTRLKNRLTYGKTPYSSLKNI